MLVYESIPGAQDIRAPHKDEIEVADTFLMSPITKPIEADPLNRVKNEQDYSKNQEVNQRKRICQEFSHNTKIKNRTCLSAVHINLLAEN